MLRLLLPILAATALLFPATQVAAQTAQPVTDILGIKPGMSSSEAVDLIKRYRPDLYIDTFVFPQTGIYSYNIRDASNSKGDAQHYAPGQKGVSSSLLNLAKDPAYTQVLSSNIDSGTLNGPYTTIGYNAYVRIPEIYQRTASPRDSYSPIHCLGDGLINGAKYYKLPATHPVLQQGCESIWLEIAYVNGDEIVAGVARYVVFGSEKPTRESLEAQLLEKYGNNFAEYKDVGHKLPPSAPYKSVSRFYRYTYDETGAKKRLIMDCNVPNPLQDTTLSAFVSAKNKCGTQLIFSINTDIQSQGTSVTEYGVIVADTNLLLKADKARNDIFKKYNDEQEAKARKDAESGASNQKQAL